jgi:transglutaminase-like putative cysteine protease
MKSIFKFVIAALCCFCLTNACQNNKHFLTNETYRNEVHDHFLKRKQEVGKRGSDLFSVFNKRDLTIKQREALEFLYAYMPWCDLADYDGEFFLKQVDAAFNARDYFHWGKTIPEDIFRHFVLVYRINNEYLDTARLAFFEELKDRIKGLSMGEAALEVNHWCHEKVTYRGTDGRTSAPLALVRTSWGRCGEESTFTATALRAVGIPARQCYTPRWVHTDDNHAWVEVWIDGQWHYMGACEPEPELDMAWFTAPAKRAMMVHTTVFGKYTGPEEKNLETLLYSKINLLANYAKTRHVNVKIVDEHGQPVNDATVKFHVYNYAEFYPISTNLTNKEGITSITSGMGDLMIWANKDDLYGYGKSTPTDEIVTIQLNRIPGKVYVEDITMNVPPEQKVKEVAPEKIIQNVIRLAQEDSIRNAYMNTFATREYAAELAKKTNLDKDNVWKYLQMAQGNWQEISNFLETEKDSPYIFPFLASLLEKDLRDTPADYLRDHLSRGKDLIVKPGTPKELIASKILSPRIALELIKPWRSFFLSKVSEDEIIAMQQNVDDIITFVSKEIKIEDEKNYYNCYITPRGVYELGISDRRSRDVLFVALCRSFGIAAQIEQATGKPQYYENGEWKDAIFEKIEEVTATPKVNLTLLNAASNTIKPGYSTHFTLDLFKDGDFQSLDYWDSPIFKNFPVKVKLDEGYYRLMVGSRANDGSVSIHNEYFRLYNNENVTKTVTLPETIGKIFVQGIVDMNTVVVLDDNKKCSLKELANGKGLMLCFVDMGKEPSKHIVQDLPAQQKELEEWNGGIVLMTPGDKLNKTFDASAFRNLPAQTIWGIDHECTLLNNVASALQIEFRDNFPLMVYVSNNGGILYSSVGYRIGIGENIIKTIRLEEESLKKK